MDTHRTYPKPYAVKLLLFSLWKNAFYTLDDIGDPCRSIIQNHSQLIALMFSISFGQILIYCLGNGHFSFHLSFHPDSTQIIVVK